MKTKKDKYLNVMDVKVDIPEGEKGDWKIERLEITKEQASLKGTKYNLVWNDIWEPCSRAYSIG